MRPASLVWDSKADKVTADVHEEELWPLLEDVAHQTRLAHFCGTGHGAEGGCEIQGPPRPVKRCINCWAT